MVVVEAEERKRRLVVLGRLTNDREKRYNKY